VFLKFASILNLAAFVAHAVFGCCGHHQHDSHQGCCSSTACQVASGSNLACCHDSVASHDHAVSGEVFSSEQFVASANDDCPSDQPCRSGGCDEGRCSFVSSSSDSNVLPDTLTCVVAIWQFQSQKPDADTSSFSWQRRNTSRLRWDTSQSLCAALQSWQI